MKILNKATVYKCKLPAIANMEIHLSACAFSPVLESMFSSSGFIEINGQMVTEVAGGFAVTLRHDEKIMPKAALARLVDERVQAELGGFEVDDGNDEPAISKERLQEIKDEVYQETIKTALIKTTHIRAFYFEADNIFLVETTNKTLASIMTDRIVQAVGSVEFVTVYLNSVIGDLTARLHNFAIGVDGSTCFGQFTMGGMVKLKDETDTMTVSFDDIAKANAAILEAIGHGMQVQQIELYHDLVSFKIDKQFRLSAISYGAEPDNEQEAPEEKDDPVFYWRTEAGVRLLQVVSVVRELLVMFEYKQPDLLEPELRDLQEDQV